MSKFPFTASAMSVTVFVNGRQHAIGSDHSGFNALVEHLKGDVHDAEFIENCVDKAAMVSRLTSGAVTVVGTTVYHNGDPLHNTLAMKLVQMLDMGFDATPWARFMDNLMQNPSENSRNQLFDFLTSFNAPFTDDGCFLVFKRVTQDYKSIHRAPDGSQLDNSIGARVTMPREEVVDDPNRTCSSGLHVCSIGYLDSGYGSSGRTVACKVNPRDVVSVPVDYKFAKIRCCEYVVLGDIDEKGSNYTTDKVANAAYIDTGVVAAEEAAADKEDAPDTAYDSGDYDGYVITDEWVDDGDVVLHQKTGRIGLVMESWECEYDDPEHPEYNDWRDGSTAGADIDVLYAREVTFDDGDTVETFLSAEDSDEFLKLVPSDDDVDEAPEDTNEHTIDVSLVDRTGKTFTMAQTAFISEVQSLGQRGFDRKYNVPRTTVQDLLKRIGD